jgi:phosphate transport system substrate-binding protein
MGFVFSAIGLNGSTASEVLGPLRQRTAQLHIAGSDTMEPLLREIAAKYRLLHPDVSIEVGLRGTARGLDDVRSGHADIAMLSRALVPAERDLYSIPIARDGVGIVVHASRPLRQLSVEQLRDIFTGRVRAWDDLDGSAEALHSVGDLRGGAATELLARFLKQPPEAIVVDAAIESTIERLAAVAAHENAIAVVSVGSAEKAIAQGVPLRLVPISSVAASSANIRNGSYPLCRALTLVSKDAPVGLARSFFAFCLSAQVNGILSAFDCVPYLD